MRIQDILPWEPTEPASGSSNHLLWDCKCKNRIVLRTVSLGDPLKSVCVERKFLSQPHTPELECPSNAEFKKPSFCSRLHEAREPCSEGRWGPASPVLPRLCWPLISEPTATATQETCSETPQNSHPTSQWWGPECGAGERHRAPSWGLKRSRSNRLAPPHSQGSRAVCQQSVTGGKAFTSGAQDPTPATRHCCGRPGWQAGASVGSAHGHSHLEASGLGLGASDSGSLLSPYLLSWERGLLDRSPGWDREGRVAVCWDAGGRSGAQEVVLGKEATDGRAEGGSVVFGAGTDEVAVRNRSV